MQTPFPIFATAIRGNIATDSLEESLIPYIGSSSQPNPWKDHMFYAMTSDINSNAILSVASFGELRNTFISSAQLPEFSFLAVDSLREPEHVRSGVVAYNGLISNTAARGNFTVVMNSDPNVRNFNVAFNNQVYSSAPTVIVFPNWFGVGDKYNPEIVEDVVLVLKEIDTAGFEVKLQSPVGRSYLGFNFMVIGPDAGNTIKHGVFYQCTTYINPNPSTAHGIVAHDTPCSNAGWLHTVSTTVMLGVEVVFDTPFSDIPSVIVSPIVPNAEVNLNFSVRCIVESITKIGARVKCGWMKIDITPATYQIVPFSIVAVGN